MKVWKYELQKYNIETRPGNLVHDRPYWGGNDKNRPHTKPCRASPTGLVNTFYKNRTQFLVTV